MPKPMLEEEIQDIVGFLDKHCVSDAEFEAFLQPRIGSDATREHIKIRHTIAKRRELLAFLRDPQTKVERTVI